MSTTSTAPGLSFRQFRERLAVPLVAVELAYGPDSQLKQGGQDVMWQKERLLNLALQSLPDGCKNVAALDCDVIFGTDDWPERATQALRRSVILQPYGLVYDLPRDWASHERLPAGLRRRQSGKRQLHPAFLPPPASANSRRTGAFNYSRGIAWAARRELLDQCRFYAAGTLSISIGRCPFMKRSARTSARWMAMFITSGTATCKTGTITTG